MAIGMWKYLDLVLVEFRVCFNRKATFYYFIIIVIGLMLSSDSAGITSIIRTLGLEPTGYEALVHFFRSSAWTLAVVRKQWMWIVKNSGVLFTENGMPILIGDGVKQPKEGKKMPGVKRMHQESENSGKPEYIFGHMFGVVGVLVGNVGKLFCLPLSASLQDGDKVMRKWADEAYESVSHVVQIVRDAFSIAVVFGDCILVLDAYFFTTSLLKDLAKQAVEFDRKLSIVTRARMSTIAYTLPIPHKGRGRPRKKGEAIKLKQLFESEEENFTQAKVWLYGKEETILYLCKDLLWGAGFYELLRFVLVKIGDKRVIVVCTNFSFTAEQAICLYGYRFKIEVTFRTLKQLLKGFAYHFWSASMPKLNRFAKKEESDPLAQVRGKKERNRILLALKAIEGYVTMSLIANGLLQLLSLKYSALQGKSSFCWLRTASGSIVTEASMSMFLRKEIFMQFHKQPHLAILQIIRSRMALNNDSDLPGAA